ncbi:MAG: OadG family transporter subunit [Rikenellaceae bacterium]
MFRKLIITSFLTLCAFFSSAQNVKDIRINEILAINETNLVDEYGARGSWIELYNTSHSRISIAGCYLKAVIGADTLSYRIPASDHRTALGPMEYMIFYCNGNSSKGTFYTNFTLEGAKEVIFSNASNETLNTVKFSPEAQQADISLGLVKKDGEMVWQPTEYTTVMASNELVNEQTGSEMFQERDPSGVFLAITAICVVFSALLGLFLLFKLVGVIIVGAGNRKNKKSTASAPAIKVSAGIDEEVVAAIALAFKLHQEDLHDKESAVLTINRVARAYSPWSSKIYGINQLPNKK